MGRAVSGKDNQGDEGSHGTGLHSGAGLILLGEDSGGQLRAPEPAPWHRPCQQGLHSHQPPAEAAVPSSL